MRHIDLMLRLYNIEPAEHQTRIVELMREFDLLPLHKKPLAELSRGQRYKAALTSTLAIAPDVLLFDEPFASGMDPHGINSFKRHCRAAAERGQTVIYKTQLLDIAERFSDKACILHQGIVRAFDSPANLKAKHGETESALDEIFEKLREQPAE